MTQPPIGHPGTPGGLTKGLPVQQENVAIGKAPSVGPSAEHGSSVAGVPSPGAPAADASAQEKPTLAPGGTTAWKPESEDSDSLPAIGGGAGKVAGAAAAVPVAGAAAQVMAVMVFLNYLKGLAMAAMALVANLWNLLGAAVLAIGKSVVGAVMGVGAAISNAVGGAVSAVVAGVASVVAGAAVATLVVAGAVSASDANNLAFKDAPLAKCTVAATAALDNVEGSGGAVDAQTKLNAQTIFSVLSAWGMPDENIAGILGNWDAESGIDPTSVQNHFDSPHQMSEKKLSASSNTDNGIGLGQWTFGRNTNLREYADTHGEDWWTLTIQLGFMLSAAEGSDAAVVKDMIANPVGSPALAALHFHEKWERSADTPAMAKRRGDYAKTWMGLFGGWTKNQTLADSILAQSGTTVTGANVARAASLRNGCRSVEEAPAFLADGNAPGPWGGFENGKISESTLAALPWTTGNPRLLRADAAIALAELNDLFRAEFGYDLRINSAYRDYAGQVDARNDWCARGSCQNAALPGTSNHGWALAVDIGDKNGSVLGYSSAEYLWLKAHAATFGWVHPAYMEPGGSGPFEAWHWEFYGLVPAS